MLKVALICSCFNRLNLTKSSFNSIYHALKNTKKIKKFHFFALDDNSKDQTFKFLKNFKNTSVYKSSGNLYWAGGMNKCFDYFYQDIIKYDILIPFNDDILITVNNLNHLVNKYENLLMKEKNFMKL